MELEYQDWNFKKNGKREEFLGGGRFDGQSRALRVAM